VEGNVLYFNLICLLSICDTPGTVS